MDLSNLKPNEGSTKNRKRIGRGAGSGRGGTSTRGHKGQKAISGYNHKRGFEGGQMPLQRRLPKFGFKNFNRVEYKPVNIDLLIQIAEKLNVNQISKQFLVENGIISSNSIYKILGRGDINKAITVEGNAISKTAKEKLEKAGGSFKLI